MKQTSESRRRQRPPKKKWMAPVAVLILGLVIIGGYFYIAQQQTKRGLTESQQSAIKKVTSKQRASKGSAVKPSDMGESRGRSSQSTAGSQDYVVDVAKLLRERSGAVFTRQGVNAPTRIELQADPQTANYRLTIQYQHADAVTMKATIRNVATKTIKVFSADAAGQTRTVKCNTEIKVGAFTDEGSHSQTAANMIGDKFYLFYNAHGTVSLVTPNYAGNVETKANTAIMNEYVQASSAE